MHASVADAWYAFNAQFEGALNFMYLDVKGLVTTGVGNLIDPISSALGLPWKNPDGSRASQAAIRTAWESVKSKQGWRLRGGVIYGSLTTIRLDWPDVEALVRSKLRNIELDIVARFPAFDAWPADAQMAILSMAWAMGPFFNFPRFADAARRQDFATCADECAISTVGNPGVAPRNRANARLFRHAANAVESLATLHWPEST